MEILIPDLTYHIFNHANGNENIFRNDENFRFFLEKFKIHIHSVASVIAYCLLPNHFHFMVKIRSEKELSAIFEKFKDLKTEEEQSNFISKQFSNLFSSYTQSFNKVNNRMGSLFVKNFKRELIRSDKQFQNTFLYIQLNAVKHGFVSHEMEWKWGSWMTYYLYSKSEKPEELITALDIEFAISKFESIKNLMYCHELRREKILAMKELEVE